MGFTLKTKVGGVERMIDAAVGSLEDLKKPLQRFGKYLRFKVNRKFQQQGPGWAPRASASATAARVKDYHAGLQKKLEKDVQRAEKKAKNPKTVERRQQVLAEFKRLEAGGKLDETTLPPKQLTKLQGRMARAKQKGERLLGKMPGSIRATVGDGALQVFSEIEWAGVHNDGGTAGHGSKIPQREFLSLDDEDLDVLEAFILDEVEAAIEKS